MTFAFIWKEAPQPGRSKQKEGEPYIKSSYPMLIVMMSQKLWQVLDLVAMSNAHGQVLCVVTRSGMAERKAMSDAGRRISIGA